MGILRTEDNNVKVDDDQKPSKVKIQGRRRLCKASSRENNHTDHTVPNFSVITDFDSSPGTCSFFQAQLFFFLFVCVLKYVVNFANVLLTWVVVCFLKF